MIPVLQLIWTSLLAYSIIQGVILFFVFPTFRQGSGQAKWLLASLSLLSAIVLTEDLFETLIGYKDYPHLIFAFGPFWYTMGPLLYFYIRLYVFQKKVKWYDAWHFAPMVFIIFNNLDFYLLAPEYKLYYLESIRNAGDVHPTHNLSFIIFSTQCIAYLGITSYMLWSRKIQRPVNREFRWISLLIITLGFITLQSFITLFVVNKGLITEWTGSLYYISLSIFLLTLYLGSIKSPGTLYLPGKPLTFRASDTMGTQDDFKKVRDHLHSSKSFADPDYDIQHLATQLGYSKHFIKTLIREHAQLSFKDFVNQFRVEEAKKRLKSPQSQQYTIASIAIESGFASQATFYRVFKKVEGCTPKSFITN